MNKDPKIKVFCDGGARGNPGPAASAFVVEVDGKAFYKESKFLGKATNNVAEYSAVILALDWLAANVAGRDVEIVLDSELVAKQMAGVFKIKNENLRNLFLKAKGLEKKGSVRVSYAVVRREKNKLADFLVNKSLNENT